MFIILTNLITVCEYRCILIYLKFEIQNICIPQIAKATHPKMSSVASFKIKTKTNLSSMFCYLFVVIFFIIYTNATSICKISTIGNKTISDPKVLSGFNDNLGSDLQINYNDKSLLNFADKSWPGAFRHPGGNPANYWNFTNASYVTPCNDSTYYNRCGGQQNIDKWPIQTFSAKNFSNGIGSASSIPSSTYNHTIVFDLNLLTLSGDEMLNQLIALKLDNYNGINGNYFELGNEYYINKFYNWTFPNSTIYIKKALPLINKIRNDFGNIQPKIAAVSQRSFDLNDSWNVGIAEYKEYYDAVTIHDYSLSVDMVEKLSPMDQISFISIYGQSVIPQYIEYVKKLFGENKKIWMTEYNLGLNSNAFNSTIMESVIHSMFTMSYISSSICNNDIMELLMYHSWNNANYGSDSGFMPIFLFDDKSDDINDAEFGVMAQLYAHLNWIGLIKNNQMHCLNADQQCPNLDINVVGNTQLKCVFGVAFTNDSNANIFGFYLVNSCQFEIEISLNGDNFMNTLTEDITLEYWRYLWNQQGDYVKFGNCDSNQQLWECGPVKPEYNTMIISKSQISVNMTLSPLSLTLAVTK